MAWDSSLTKEIGEGIAVSVAAIIASALVLFRKKYAEKVAKGVLERIFKGELHGEMERNKGVDRLISELLIETNAARAYVIQFQNGSVFSTKNPVWKLSMTYETVKEGFAPASDNFQDIKSSLTTGLISCFWDDTQSTGIYKLVPQTCVCNNTAACAKTSSTYLFKVDELPMQNYRVMLEKNATKHMIWTPLLDADHIVGFVGIEYCDSSIDPITYIPHATAVCACATRVSFELLK